MLIRRVAQGLVLLLWVMLCFYSTPIQAQMFGPRTLGRPISRQRIPGSDKMPCVFAYHEIVKSPSVHGDEFDPTRCDVYYQGKLSPDFYAWIFPHGNCTSIGVGSAVKGFSLRGAVGDLRAMIGTDACELVRGEGAPIPLKPLKKWHDGRGVVLAGDAAGVVGAAGVATLVVLGVS